MRIERLAPEEVLGPRLSQIAEVWTWADEARIEDILPRHVDRDGFRFVAAEVEGRVAGFAYGYLGGAGQWWHDIVAASLDEQRRQLWLAPGHFELVELHVRAERRRQGIGGRLHDELLTGLDSPTAVLSTQTDNEAATRLYERRGWVTIAEPVRFGIGGRAFRIMGLDLSRHA